MVSNPAYLERYLAKELQALLEKKYSCLILGPRQVGKTTMVKRLLEKAEPKFAYYLQNPETRLNLEKDPGFLVREVSASDRQAVVFVDEAQKVPDVFDSAQLLIDNKTARFILTGSSARKLRRKGANLLPGRIKQYYLDPLTWGELGFVKNNTVPELAIQNINRSANYSFKEMLVFGSLPGIVGLPVLDRADFLSAYAVTYLEEEIRAESLSRKIGAFSRFLELAAQESGTSPNYSKLSNEAGVSIPAIKEFYELLADTLIVERVEPYIKNARKRILAAPRYYFFDLGVRNAVARLPLQKDALNIDKGRLFEHAVILEILRRIRVLRKNYKVYYWRTYGGAEVDCVIDCGREVIPVEIKCDGRVREGELKGLKIFLEDYKTIAKRGYVVTMGEKKEKITENITAVPWEYL